MKASEIYEETRERARSVGLPPGTPKYTGLREARPVRIRWIEYSPESATETELASADQVPEPGSTEGVTWIDVNGLHREGLVEAIGKRYSIHHLMLEDILDISERPKLERRRDVLFLLVKAIRYNERSRKVVNLQVSLILGPGFVLSFRERSDHIFDALRKRIAKGKGRIRSQGADYLAYSILDSIVDDYFRVLEKVSDRIAALEVRVLRDSSQYTLQETYAIRQESLTLRRTLRPMRALITNWQRLETGLISEENAPYLDDLSDSVEQAIETIEHFRTTLNDILEVYNSNVNHRTNEVMRVLTVIATIFIPLTFVASIYGMNIVEMPLADNPYGFWIIILFMLLGTGMMLGVFRKRGWV